MDSGLIYKLCGQDEWDAAVGSGTYRGSTDDARDGFIYFSRAHQVAGTAAKYFAGRTDLLLVAVEARALGDALRHEPSRGGELFPHLYAELSTHSVSWVRAVPWDGTQHVLPTDL